MGKLHHALNRLATGIRPLFLLLYLAQCVRGMGGERATPAVGLAFGTAATGDGEARVDPIAATLKGAMIWDATDTASPASVGFRKTLSLPGKPASATLHIFADTRYMLWINGRYVARGPNRFDPKRPEYDTLQVSGYLNAGVNTLAVLVQSRLSNYRFIKHTPGLCILLETAAGHDARRFTTDTSWRSTAGTRFAPPVVLLSGIADRVDEPGIRRLDRCGVRRLAVAGCRGGRRRALGRPVSAMIPLLRESLVEGERIVSLTQSGAGLAIGPSVEVWRPLELKAPAVLLIDVGQMVRAGFELDFEPHGEARLELRPRESYTDRDAAFLGACRVPYGGASRAAHLSHHG